MRKVTTIELGRSVDDQLRFIGIEPSLSEDQQVLLKNSVEDIPLSGINFEEIEPRSGKIHSLAQLATSQFVSPDAANNFVRSLAYDIASVLKSKEIKVKVKEYFRPIGDDIHLFGGSSKRLAENRIKQP